MDFQTAVRTCLAVKYVDFTGRAARSEFWWFVLFNVIVQIVVSLLAHLLGSFVDILGILVYLALFLPGLAVSIRRLHDKDKSGWFVLLSFIPVIGILVLLYWYCTPGTPGTNQYGPDPLGGASPAP